MRIFAVFLVSALVLVACNSNLKTKPTPPVVEPLPVVTETPEEMKANMIKWCEIQDPEKDIWICRCMDYSGDDFDPVCEDDPFDPWDQIVVDETRL